MLKFVSTLVLRDSPSESPFVPKSKCMPLGLLGSMITAGTQMSANYDTNKANREIAELNYKSQKETNEVNRQIAQQANEWNYKMMQEQNQWNLEQWNRQNEYNSPAHMVQMYKNAGLNPALLAGQSPIAAGGLNSADAKAAQTAYATAPQMDYHPITTDFTALGNNFQAAVNAYFQNRLIDSQRKKTDLESSGQGILNERNIRFMPYELQRLQNDAKKEGVLGDIARTELDFQKKSFQTRLDMLYGDSAIQQKSMKLMDEQLNGQILDNQMKQIMNAYQPKWNDMQIRQASMSLQQVRATIGLINANTTLTQEQAYHEIEKKIGTIIDNGMKSIDYKVRDDIKDYLIQSAEADMINKWQRNEYQRYVNRDYHFDKFVKRVSAFIPMAPGITAPILPSISK